MVQTQPPDVCDVTARWMFLQALRASRLFTDQQVQDLLAIYPEASTAELKRRLADAELLTPYQLRKIADRQTEGLVIGPYHILRELGQGGFGQVYLARHSLMGRTVALKTLGEQWAAEPVGREYFLREVVGGTRLAHPHIALSYDAGDHEGRLYLAIEYVDGPTLDGYVTARGPLGPAELAAVLAQTAAALGYASGQGVIHRDLKPANVLLGPRTPPPGGDGVPFAVKVIDFGLARFHDHDALPVGTIMCEAGAVVGTPSYMAPEQVGDVHNVDVRTDLYALGGTAYFAATGRVPFAGRSTHHIIQAVLHGAPVPLDQLRPDLPLWLVEVIERLMARDPADRYQTADELIAAVTRTPAEPLPPPPAAYDPPPLPDSASVAVPPPADTEVVLTATEVEDFAPWWQEWHRQVGRLAANQPADLTDPEYRSLQRTLLRAVRGATTGPAAAHRPRLLGTVEPWVSLKALTALDRRTLGDVWAECQKVDAAVAGGKRSKLKWW